MEQITVHITSSHSPNLQDQERLQTLVNMAATNMAMSIANAGHSFAMAASARDLSPAAHLSELFGGITQVRPLAVMKLLIRSVQSEDMKLWSWSKKVAGRCV